jgi:putative DNA methylase
VEKDHYDVLTKAEAFRLGMPDWSSRGYIPHFTGNGVTQHITFRLPDSMPRAVIEGWEMELKTLPESKRQQQRYELVERYLDAGHGACHLREAQCAEVVQNAILFFAGERHDLHAWCVMPNHVHALMTPYEGWTWSEIAGSWLSFSAKECNKILGRTGQFWQREPFDRYMRDQKHFEKTVQYIENNPVKAGLCVKPEDWPWSSAAWRLQQKTTT